MSSKSKHELIDLFIKNAEAAVASVEKIQASAESLNSSLIKITADEHKVLLAKPDYIDEQYFSIFLSNPKVITKPTKEEMSSVKIGITDCMCAIAGTGSVCVSITKTLSSPMSMLTKIHIAIVDANKIVSRPSDVFSKDYLKGKGLTGSFTFITGPSATADMGPLVRGVHGPGKLHIIILD